MFAALKLVKKKVTEVRLPVKKNSGNFSFEKSSAEDTNMT